MNPTLIFKCIPGVAITLAALVLVPVPGQGQEDVYRNNVVIILDASGSMNGPMELGGQTKIEVAKMVLKDVLGNLEPGTTLGLLAFGQNSEGWLFKLGPRDAAACLARVDTLTAGGGTPLGAYMKQGADALLHARESQFGYGSYRLLIITDGEASDRDVMERYTPEIISRGIITDVIGVKMAGDHLLATKVHSYRRADDRKALQQAVREVFAEIGRLEGGGGGEVDFSALDGLPVESAAAMLKALASSGNQPIGGKAASPSPAAPVPAPPSSSGGSSFGFGTVVLAFILLFVVWSALKRIIAGR